MYFILVVSSTHAAFITSNLLFFNQDFRFSALLSSVSKYKELLTDMITVSSIIDYNDSKVKIEKHMIALMKLSFLNVSLNR